MKVKNAKTKADWMKAMAASGMEKADFEKRLAKMEGGYAAAFSKAMEEEDYKEEDDDKTSKSFELELLETDIEALEADLAKSSGPLDSLDTDVFDTEEIRGLEQVDVSGLIKSMTEGTRQGFRVAAAGNEALRRMIEVQGKLTTRLAKSLIESRRGQDDLMDEIQELRKSLTELGNSPAMRRGATTEPGAKAAARFAKSDDKGVPEGYLPVSNPDDVLQAFEKSMAEAEKLGNTEKLSDLSYNSIKWVQAKNRGAKIIPNAMASLINYRPSA